jgi:hypothetical protein
MDFFPLSRAELQGLPSIYPTLFDVCHFILAAIAVRKEFGVPFTRTHPFAAWLAHLSASFAGSLVCNPLLGKPVFAALSSEQKLLQATLVWLVVCYSPGDLAHSLVKNKALYIPVCVVKEIYRAKKVVGGIADASKVFPDHELAMVIIGTIKGNGSGVIKPVTRLLGGVWKPASSEILEMSVTTKECAVAAVLLVLDQGGHIPSVVSGTPLYIAIIAVFLLTKISSALGEAVDPFAVIESAISSLILAGQDGMEEAVKEKPEEEEEAVEEEAVEDEAMEDEEEAEKDEEEKKNE